MTFPQLKGLENVLLNLYRERERQHKQWGEQNHPDGTGGKRAELDAEDARRRCERAFAEGGGTWRHLLAEEVAEAFAETDPAKLRAELIQVAALACQWVEAIDRRQRSAK
jgi:hypothetical protein